jgi:hypothetical protein
MTWALLAWAWQRLSFAVIPRRWWAILTGALEILESALALLCDPAEATEKGLKSGVDGSEMT